MNDWIKENLFSLLNHFKHRTSRKYILNEANRLLSNPLLRSDVVRDLI